MTETGDLGEHAPGRAGWRLIEPADLPFLYQLVTLVDPRWWRFSRHGLEPAAMLQTVQGIAAGVIVHDDGHRPVAAGLLTDAGASGTGNFELFALPADDALATARAFAPELVAAAFAGAPIRRLYHERFAGDPEVLGAVGELFEIEVTYPAFAQIDGRYEDRTISVLTRERFEQWQIARAS